jgi:hypothetical protein
VIEIVRAAADSALDRLRERLALVLPRSGRLTCWQEWDPADPTLPAHLGRDRVPTLYVDGRAVLRLDGEAPDDAALAELIRGGVTPPAFRWSDRLRWQARALGRTVARVGPALALALLPKCPACLAFYLGTTSVVGAAFLAQPILVAAVLASSMTVLWAARRSLLLRPALMWIAGAALLVGGRYGGSDIGVMAGCSLVVAASFWEAWIASPRPLRVSRRV